MFWPPDIPTSFRGQHSTYAVQVLNNLVTRGTAPRLYQLAVVVSAVGHSLLSPAVGLYHAIAIGSDGPTPWKDIKGERTALSLRIFRICL